MTNEAVWARLELEPTGDTRAIRRAYSQQLKAINVDADPAGFIALREALERALWLAEMQARQANVQAAAAPVEEGAPEPNADADVNPVDEPADALADAQPAPPPAPVYETLQPVPTTPTPPAPPAKPAFETLKPAESTPKPLQAPTPAPEPEQARPAPQIRIVDQEIDRADLARLQALLTGQEDIASVRDEIGRLTRTILEHPAMERIDRSADMENWLANIIVNAIPRSDVMLAPAIAKFRWRDHVGALKRNPAIDVVLRRDADLRFLGEVAVPGNRWNRAYHELTAPPAKGFRLIGSAMDAQVGQLLNAINRDYPGLRTDLNAEAVAWWSKRLAKNPSPSAARTPTARRRQRGSHLWNPSRVVRTFVVVVLMMFFFVGLINILDPTPQTVPPPPSQSTTLSTSTDTAAPTDLTPPPDTEPAPTTAPAGFDPAILARAMAGDTRAMNAVGLAYVNTTPDKRDLETASHWFRASATRGDTQGMMDLALLEGTGTGIYGNGVNLADASRWYERAAAKGFAPGEYMFGQEKLHGVIVPQDYAGAIALLKKASARGFTPATQALHDLSAPGIVMRSGSRLTHRTSQGAPLQNPFADIPAFEPASAQSQSPAQAQSESQPPPAPSADPPDRGGFNFTPNLSSHAQRSSP